MARRISLRLPAPIWARVGLLVAVVGGGVVAWPLEPASATSTTVQETSSTSEATTSTQPGQEPSSTTASPPSGGATSSSTTVAPPADGDPPPTADGSPTDPPTGETPPIDDPLSGEGQGEEAPGVDPELPPPDTYGDQGPYEPPEILWSSVAEAERKLARSREARREAVAAVRSLRLRSKHLDLDQQALDRRTRLAVEELLAAQARFRHRAVTDYRLFAAGVEPEPAAAIGPSELGEVMQRRRGSHLAAAAVVIGRDDLDRLGLLRQSLDGETRTLLDRLRLVADYLLEAKGAVAETDAEIEQAGIEYEAFKAGSEIFISGVVYPIGGPYDLPLVDSFGFPRMTGTPDEHWHEGIDLFAPRGTPLVATERGLVTRVGSGRLGGLKLWLVGESGTEWYYAHLDSFAPGLHDGQIVESGDLLGYVGNTGNAVGTPPHLHLQMHPDGGRPVNPYPLLKTVSDLDQAAVDAGTAPGWQHEPVVGDRATAAAGSGG